MKLLVDARTRRCEAATAILRDLTGHASAEVKPLLTGAGESACDRHAVDGPRVSVEPDRIVGSQLSINPSGLRFEGRSVEGEHRKPHNLETHGKWVKSRYCLNLYQVRVQGQVQAELAVGDELGLGEKPRLRVFNKTDKLDEESQAALAGRSNGVFISGREPASAAHLLAPIEGALRVEKAPEACVIELDDRVAE